VTMIVVAGESLVDLVVDAAGGITPRLGGGPFNVARGLARLDVRCALLASVSTDGFGSEIRQALIADGVETRCLVESERPTTLAMANVREGTASYRFYTEGTAAPALSDADVATVLPAALDALHVGTLGLALEPIGSTLERLVLNVGEETLVMVDPNVRREAVADEDAYRQRLWRVLGRADVVKVSLEDLDFLAPDRAVADAAGEMLSGRTRCVLVTAGAEPVRVITAAGEEEVGTVPVRVTDTIGAGDAFCAGFLSRWRHKNRTIAELGDLDAAANAALFAALVAGVTCQRVGANPPSFDDLSRAEVLAW